MASDVSASPLDDNATLSDDPKKTLNNATENSSNTNKNKAGEQDVAEKNSEQIKKEASGSKTDTAEDKKVSVLEAHGYLLGDVLGSGSYATVKTAFSSRHNMKVAVKIISKKKSPASYVNKFLPREIDAVRILKHPNIVAFYQSIETTNRVYLIMEVAEGGDVLKAIREHKHIEEINAAKWFGQIIGAIEYCHSKGVVHRDLKSENLLLDKAKNIKVTDFGFARVYDLEGPMSPSETFCGSYPYAPPEILRGIPYEPKAADIWSIGIILFTMVFGRLPFDDANHRTLVKQVMAGPQFPSKHSYQTNVSSECRELLIKILKPMPNRASFEVIKQDPWFDSHSKDSMVIKTTKDNPASLMEVLKEDGPVVDSEDTLA